MIKHYEKLGRAAVMVLLVMLMPISMLASKTVYMTPNSWWFNDGARCAVYYFGGSTTDWSDMTAVEGEANVYQAEIAEDATTVIFVRMKGDTTENNWDNKFYNQTNDIVLPTDGSNLFTIDNNGANGTWSTFVATEVPTAHTVYFMPNTAWAGFNPRFAVYYFKSEADNGWVDMELAAGEKKIYTAVVPAGYEDIVFVRFDADDSENVWEKEWTQTENLKVQDGENLFYPTLDATEKDQHSSGLWVAYPLIATEDLEFADDQDDVDVADALSENMYKVANVTLQGRTLFKDGSFNSLCVPFSVTSGQLGNATLMTINDASLENGVLRLTFKNVEYVNAGVPFLLKWEDGEDWENPTFENVLIEYSYPNVYYNIFDDSTYDEQTDTWSDYSYMVEFDSWGYGRYWVQVAYTEQQAQWGTIPDGKQVGDLLDGQSTLFLGENNILYEMVDNGYIGAFRAFFLITYDESTSAKVNNIVLDLDEEEITGIKTVNETKEVAREGIYTISGQRVSKPAKGLYIVNGNKVIIK